MGQQTKTTAGQLGNASPRGAVAEPPPLPGAAARDTRDGPLSQPITDTRSLSPLGRSLPYDPQSAVHGGGGAGWLVPVGAALVTALVVFAIGGVVVRSYRTSDAAPAVTTANVAPATPAPDQGVPLRDAVQPKAAQAEAATDHASGPPAAKENASTRSATSPTPAETARQGSRAAGHGRSVVPTATTAPVTAPPSAADFLPGTL